MEGFNRVAALHAKAQRAILVPLNIPGADASGGNRMRMLATLSN